jgi:hypothetical protein
MARLVWNTSRGLPLKDEIQLLLLHGVRIPLIMDAKRTVVGLERDTRFRPKLLREAVEAELDG